VSSRPGGSGDTTRRARAGVPVTTVVFPARAPATTAPLDAAVVEFDHVSLAFDDTVVLKDISFIVRAGHTTIILGASGAGKSIILKILMGLMKPDGGAVLIDGRRVDQLDGTETMRVRDDVGMVFQDGALFDSLTVRENVGYRLDEETDMASAKVDARVVALLGFMDLSDYINRMPAELSGGQRRRVAIARAMASHPKVLLYDEPTSGLDPLTATTVNDEIIKLRDLELVTSIIVTHQLRDAFYLATHQAVRETGTIHIVTAAADKERQTVFMMMHEGLICFEGDADKLLKSADPYVKAFMA